MADVAHWKLMLLIGGLVVLSAGAGLYFRDYFQPPQAIELPLDECDLHQGPCVRTLPDGGQVRFSILPRSIPLVKPLTLDVWLQGIEAHAVDVDFSGVDMNMGYNRPRLEHVGDGHFQGEALLPVCIRQRMDWWAKVMIHTDSATWVLPFRFETRK